ncbi:MAG: cation transporting ATPase C-terminal domain-containing protein [Actinomycetota bacterium]
MSLFAIRPLSNRLLVGAVATEAIALVTFVYLPPLRRALGHHALSWRQWVPLMVAPLILLGAEETRKWMARRLRAGSP